MLNYLSPGSRFSGLVVYIANGDSLCVEVSPGPAAWGEVRLADFYAPVLSEPGGSAPKAAMKRIAWHRPVICTVDHQSYDRVVARCPTRAAAAVVRIPVWGLSTMLLCILRDLQLRPCQHRAIAPCDQDFDQSPVEPVSLRARCSLTMHGSPSPMKRTSRPSTSMKVGSTSPVASTYVAFTRNQFAGDIITSAGSCPVSRASWMRRRRSVSSDKAGLLEERMTAINSVTPNFVPSSPDEKYSNLPHHQHSGPQRHPRAEALLVVEPPSITNSAGIPAFHMAVAMPSPRSTARCLEKNGPRRLEVVTNQPSRSSVIRIVMSAIAKYPAKQNTRFHAAFPSSQPYGDVRLH